MPVEHVVPGDVVLLSAGSLVPADGVMLEATDCFVSEAVLTGESFPVEKKTRRRAARPPVSPSARTACSSARTCAAARRGAWSSRPGRRPQFGAIAHRLTLRPPETEFDRGIRRFGYLLTSAMLIMVLLVFAAHMFRGRPPVDTLLFSVALAVGLSPELLPAILSVNLARGAQMMARHGVLVRRLNAIENLGSMDVLCTDKTGTLTEGVVQLEGAYDAAGAAVEPRCSSSAACNAALETGVASPLDDAILEGANAGSRRASASSPRSRSTSCASGSRSWSHDAEGVAAHHQRRVSPRARGLHAVCRRRAARRRARDAARAALRGVEPSRASGCWPSRPGASPRQPPTAATTSAT